jgi:DNA repair protein SbcC/Rad50
MILNRLYLRNFKGIKELTIEPNGENLSIFGDNATGKTTVFDSFMWLLFDKDSQNRDTSNFSIKTLDNNGEVIHGLEHEVSAEIQHNGMTIQLQKIYKEKWVKRRGEAEKELTGHTTDYFINGVPKKQKEYKDYLASIVDENTFKILTNPLFFNKNLDWKKRREIALNICGEVQDQEVIEKNKKLTRLQDLLTDKSVEDLKAEMAARRRKLNEEIKSIPYRVDELSREQTYEIDIDAVTKEKKDLESDLEALKQNNSNDYSFRKRTIKGAIQHLELDIKNLETSKTQDLRDQIDDLKEQGAAIKSKYQNSKYEVEDTENKIARTNKLIEDNVTGMDELRERYKRIASQVFDESTNICPSCGQSLPHEEIQRHIREFEENKNKQLENINQTGLGLKTNNEEYEKEINELNKTLDTKKAEVVEYYNEMMKLSEQVKQLEEQLKSVNIEETEEYKQIKKQIEEKENEVKELEELEKNEDNSVQIREIEHKIDELNKQIARVDLIKHNEKRINELKDRERELAEMIADIEKKESLCEQFILTKANLLENKLNSKFKLVSFKLFNTLVNGGIEETFVTTVNGVPFDDLNNAMKINAGLDIINTLTKYYSFNAPIFIDNRESVNEIVDIDSQIINLVVSKDKKLKIEEIKEVA